MTRNRKNARETSSIEDMECQNQKQRADITKEKKEEEQEQQSGKRSVGELQKISPWTVEETRKAMKNREKNNEKDRKRMIKNSQTEAAKTSGNRLNYLAVATLLFTISTFACEDVFLSD